MLTWGDLLSNLRLDMGEKADSPRLSEEQAFIYLEFALRDYSGWNPLTRTALLDLDEEGRAPLPDDCLRVVEVRDPVSKHAIQSAWGVQNPPRLWVPSRPPDIRWWQEGNTICLSTWSDLPSGISVLYDAQHPAPSSADDLDFQFTFPDIDEEAILLYIRGKFMSTQRGKTAQLDRYKSRMQAGNTRVDNPIAPEVDDLMQSYLAKMIERYGAPGAVLLHRRR